MKHLFRLCLTAIILLGTMKYAAAQNGDPVPLGGTDIFLQNAKKQISPLEKKSSKTFISHKISATENVTLKVNYQQTTETSGEYLVGEVEDKDSSNFFIKVDGKSLEGNIVFRKEKKAYKYYSDKDGNAYVQEVDIHSVLCIEYNELPAQEEESPATGNAVVAEALTNLQSFPGANGCILLDFDGHYVSGTPWNGGNPINAAPSGMSDAAIQEHWEVVAEDFRPFSVNVTTSESVFNSYPKNRRMRVVITPTNTAAPGAGGVAYIGSFNWNDDTPCWVFILSGKAGGEASSHEAGHTFGLGHDGRTNPSEGYFAGHGDWAPIMGVGYYKNISQWSKGQYNFANNTEDDLAKISSSTYGVGYRADDHGNSTGSATPINYSSNGNVSSDLNRGIIERTSDLDFFSFNTSGGNISLNINTVSRHGDLDILVRLYNSSGTQIGSYNPAGLHATVNANLGAGQYYISIDGTGAGNPATDGYSDYASLGSYFISGNIPPASVQGVAIAYKDCNYGGYAVGLSVGDYTLSQLNAKGILNDDISSLKVNSGYEVQLFEHDNFGGASITITSNNSCLVGNGWNDKASSLKVRTSGVTNLAGIYYLQNRNSGLYMDVANWGTQDGANILQWNFHGGTNQQYEFSHLGNGTYRITAKHSGKVLDVAGVSTNDGANVNQWTYVGGANQQFIVQSTGDGFYKLIAKHSGKLVEVGACSNQPGANIQQWTNNNQNCGHWKLVPVTPTYSNVIQAENYSAMNGVQTEATTDAGGGLNVGWIDAGDWMAYNSINFPTSGTYTIEYRVASQSGGGILSADLNAGSIVLGSVSIPSTGGWQNWTTVSHSVNVNAGTYNFGIYAQAGGWNINWIRISKQGASASITQLNSSESETELYPNPTKGELFIKSVQDFSNADVRIFNFEGREIFRSSSEDLMINVSSLNPGIYTVILSKDGVQTMERFVKE